MFHQMQLRMIPYAKFFQAPEIHRTGPPERAEDFIAFVEQKLCKVGAVLPGDAGDE